jgi:hypothetical protein
LFHFPLAVIDEPGSGFRVRPSLARRRGHGERPVLAIGRGRALGPQLDGLVLDALVLVAHERAQERPSFVAHLFKVAQLHIAINGAPLVTEPRRPPLHRAWLAMESPGDGVPRMPHGPQFRGLDQQSPGVLAHEMPPKMCASTYAVNKVMGINRPEK